MKEIIKTRLVSPNNATHKFCDYLERKGLHVNHKSRKSLSYNEKIYAITITNADRDYADCRQFVCDEYDGLITLHEKTGQIYLLDKSELLVGSKTREFSNSKFQTAQSIKKINEINPTDIVTQVDIDKYQELYVCVAEELAQNLVNIAINKML